MHPATFYSLTHIDDQALPVRLSVNGIEFLVTDGSLEFEAPSELTRMREVDGMLNWEMRGHRLPETTIGRVMSERNSYRRVGSSQIEFPMYSDARPPEYTVDVTPDELVMRTRGESDREYSALHLFGGHRSWRFIPAPSADPGVRWSHDESELIAVGVLFRGREIRWLSRLMTRIAVPIAWWRARRRLRRGA